MHGKYILGFFLVLYLICGYTFADSAGIISAITPPQVSITSLTEHSDQNFQTILRSDPIPNPDIPNSNAINSISQGDIIFIGESHLDISDALHFTQAIAWWADEENVLHLSSPDAIFQINDSFNFFVDPTYFAQKTGNWYQWIDETPAMIAFSIVDPSIEMSIFDATTLEVFTGGEFPSGHYANFIIQTNMGPILNRTGAIPADSRIKLVVTNPYNEEYTYLNGANYADKSLIQLQITSPVWYWAGLNEDHTKSAINDGWNVSAINPFTGERIYKPGKYHIHAECNANGLLDNYLTPDGSQFVNKTLSITHQLNLAGGRVTIDADGIQPFYPGEIVHLKGTSDVSDAVYLYITGEGLPLNGGILNNPLIPVLSDIPSTFTEVLISESGNWSYQWEIPLQITKDGMYTLYAAADPKNLTGLSDTYFGAVQVSINATTQDDNLHLFPGWNFIETPSVLQTGHNTMEIFADVNSSGHSILSYHALSESWVSMKKDDIFVPLSGYWIYSESEIEIPLRYDNYGKLQPHELITGWNTIGITRPEKSVSEALHSIHNIWSYLVRYNSVVQKYDEPIISDNYTDEDILYPKEGYWIYMTENGTYSG